MIAAEGELAARRAGEPFVLGIVVLWVTVHGVGRIFGASRFDSFALIASIRYW